ncbi:HNH/ENDO VII family nuclease [Pseudomonas sp. Hz4]
MQFDQNDPVSVKNRELALASRPSVNLNDKTAQVNVNAAAGDGPVGVLLPNRGDASFNVPRVQGLPDTSARSNPHKYLIETNPVLTNLKQFRGNKVYQRNDLIDPSRVDASTGFTNKQLMENGLAPYGTDGKKVNLHHMLQTQDGPIAEVTQSFHQKNSGVIHINSGSEIPSGINRAQFEKWKKDYWKSRSLDF